MRTFGIHKIVLGAAMGLAVVFGLAAESNAQSRWEIDRQRERAVQERNARLEQERQRTRRQRRSRTNRNNDPYGNGAYGRGQVNQVFQQGYYYGMMAGQQDRRRGKYNQSNVYRNTGPAPNMGDPTSNDYLYRQGYLQGYEDGYRGRY